MHITLLYHSDRVHKLNQNKAIFVDAAQNAAQPRKAHIFGHFTRSRALVHGFNLKLPLFEPIIRLSFRFSPEKAYEKYSAKRADENTGEAIRKASNVYFEALGKGSEEVDALSSQLKLLRGKFEELKQKKSGIQKAYAAQRHYLKNSSLDYLFNSSRNYELAMQATGKNIALLESSIAKAKKSAALSVAIPVLKKGLADAKRINKSAIIEVHAGEAERQ